MTTLPEWGEMTDPDRGEAVAFAWRCYRHGIALATNADPCRYTDTPVLAALDPMAAGIHALTVCGPLPSLIDRIGKTEYDRLYNLALPRPT